MSVVSVEVNVEEFFAQVTNGVEVIGRVQCNNIKDLETFVFAISKVYVGLTGGPLGGEILALSLEPDGGAIH